MTNKLSDRILTYQNATDYKLLPRLPLMISLNGRSFSRATQLLDKPYCLRFAEAIHSTMLRLSSEIEGAVFGFQTNDEIIILARNDQHNETQAWFGNSLQKICSACSSIATLHFNECSSAISLNLIGDPIFTAQVFAVPTIAEAINTFIYKQQANFHISIQSACLYNLLQKYDKETIRDMLAGLSIDGKIDLLWQECGIKYGEYSLAFRRGTAAYKIHKIVDGAMKNKWHLNTELPIFTQDQSFLSNIVKHGVDLFRADGLE